MLCLLCGGNSSSLSQVPTANPVKLQFFVCLVLPSLWQHYRITEPSLVPRFPCLQLLVLVGGEMKRAQICFLCGLEVKLVLNCFGVNKQSFTGKPESDVQVNQNLQILQAALHVRM